MTPAAICSAARRPAARPARARQRARSLSYDNEGRLAAWQNAPSSPTSTANYLYDGEGNRVFQQSTTNSSTTSTTYIGNLEDIATSGSTITTTAYYYLGGQRVAESVNGTVSYLATDLLGSAGGGAQ